MAYDDKEGLMTQRYQCIIHLAIGNKGATLIDRIDRSTGMKNKKKFLLISNITGLILDADEITCATKPFEMNRITLTNKDKAVAYGKTIGDYNSRINRGSNSMS